MSKHIKLLINKNFINFIIIASIFIIAIIWSIFCEIPLTYSNEFKKKVCIFFDDGWKNQFDVALPVLKDFGFKATFSIITDYIGIDRGTFWSRMNDDELRVLKNLGMEIASHSKTHPHMNNLTREQLIDEIINSKYVLTEMGFNVKIFVYPYGEYNSTIIDYVKIGGYIGARTISYEPYHVENLDAVYRVGSYSITNQSFEEFTRILSESNYNTIVVLTYHFISDIGPPETSTPVQNFYKQMRYLKDNNFEIILLSDVISSKSAHILTQSAPTLLDAEGRPAVSVIRNTVFYIQVTLRSYVEVDISPYVIAQIKDEMGRIVAIGITMADIWAGEMKSVPVAFLGIPAGKYIITLYVWSCLTTPTALAPIMTFTITIS